MLPGKTIALTTENSNYALVGFIYEKEHHLLEEIKTVDFNIVNFNINIEQVISENISIAR